MSKHRKHNRRKKSSSPLGEAGVGLFFSTILPFIENLEKEDQLLLVVPSSLPVTGRAGGEAFGIVISSDLALSINADYLQRMADYIRQCGSLEAYYDFRARNPKWAAKHNPDQLLLNICRAARLVIAYRYGIQLGNAEYLANDDDTLRYDNDNLDSSNNRNAEKSSLSSSLSLDESPLFITMMGYSEDMQALSLEGERGESLPQSIGYELNGEITLEEYKEKKSEEVSPQISPKIQPNIPMRDNYEL